MTHQGAITSRRWEDLVALRLVCIATKQLVIAAQGFDRGLLLWVHDAPRVIAQ